MTPNQTAIVVIAFRLVKRLMGLAVAAGLFLAGLLVGLAIALR